MLRKAILKKKNNKTNSNFILGCEIKMNLSAYFSETLG